MKRLNKVTPEVYKRLIAIAAELPNVQRTEFGKPVYGVHTQFQPSAKQTKITRIPILINHQVELIERHKKLGQPGVDEWVNHCKNLYATK